MARGWESKSVQGQIESANARRGIPRVQLTPAQIEAEKKRESLLLHRKRVLHDLENCRDERYRSILADGLAYLDAQLVALDGNVSA